MKLNMPHARFLPNELTSHSGSSNTQPWSDDGLQLLDHVVGLTGVVCLWFTIRAGNYIPGFMEVMKEGPVPDLRKTTDCPRKVVTEETMVQHRNCFKAAEDRIRVALRHGELLRVGRKLFRLSWLATFLISTRRSR